MRPRLARALRSLADWIDPQEPDRYSHVALGTSHLEPVYGTPEPFTEPVVPPLPCSWDEEEDEAWHVPSRGGVYL